MGGNGGEGDSAGGEPAQTVRVGGRVASTGCIAAVVTAILVVFVIAPALLWGLGIACGAAR
jgi:hypothetical protein